MTYARLTLALALLVAAVPAFAQHDDDDEIDKVNGSITASASHKPYRDLSTVNGSIKVESNAQAEDVETVNGSIPAAMASACVR
jgi:hypothetical protein